MRSPVLDFLNPVKGFAVTFRQMFRKVDTVEYPEEKRPTAPRFHGRHQLNRWPDGLEQCIGCELCVEACPTRALTMTNDYELADDSRESLIWTKEQLVAPLQPGMEAPPHPMRLGEDELDYYRLGPSFAAAQPTDLLSMLARSRGSAEADQAGEGGASA